MSYFRMTLKRKIHSQRHKMRTIGFWATKDPQISKLNWKKVVKRAKKRITKLTRQMIWKEVILNLTRILKVATKNKKKPMKLMWLMNSMLSIKKTRTMMIWTSMIHSLPSQYLRQTMIKEKRGKTFLGTITCSPKWKRKRKRQTTCRVAGMMRIMMRQAKTKKQNCLNFCSQWSAKAVKLSSPQERMTRIRGRKCKTLWMTNLDKVLKKEEKMLLWGRVELLKPTEMTINSPTQEGLLSGFHSKISPIISTLWQFVTLSISMFRTFCKIKFSVSLGAVTRSICRKLLKIASSLYSSKTIGLWEMVVRARNPTSTQRCS